MKHIVLLLAVLFCVAGYASQPNKLTREAKKAKFIQGMDSLVASGNFIFIPTTFRVLPSGEARRTDTDNRLAVSAAAIDINLPLSQSAIISTVPLAPDYTATKMPNGEWIITFSTVVFGTKYDFKLNVNTSTGFTQLNLLPATGVNRERITYSGNLSPQR